MQEIKNTAGKRVCDLSDDRKRVVIESKGHRTVITAGPDGTLIIKNVKPKK